MAKISINNLSLDNQHASLSQEGFFKDLSSTDELDFIHGGEIVTLLTIGLTAAALGATLGAHDRKRWGAWGW